MFMMFYAVGWLIAGFIVLSVPDFWQYLTYWGEGLMVVYFTFSFGVSLHSIALRTEDLSDSGRCLRLNA